MTLVESRVDVDDVTAVFRYSADLADLADMDTDRLVETGQPNVLSRVQHEAVGSAC